MDYLDTQDYLDDYLDTHNWTDFLKDYLDTHNWTIRTLTINGTIRTELFGNYLETIWTPTIATIGTTIWTLTIRLFELKGHSHLSANYWVTHSGYRRNCKKHVDSDAIIVDVLIVNCECPDCSLGLTVTGR